MIWTQSCFLLRLLIYEAADFDACERTVGRSTEAQLCFFPFSHVRQGEQRRRELQRVRRRVEVHHGLAEHLQELRPGQLRLHRQERAQAGADRIR